MDAISAQLYFPFNFQGATLFWLCFNLPGWAVCVLQQIWNLRFLSGRKWMCTRGLSALAVGSCSLPVYECGLQSLTDPVCQQQLLSVEDTSDEGLLSVKQRSDAPNLSVGAIRSSMCASYTVCARFYPVFPISVSHRWRSLCQPHVDFPYLHHSAADPWQIYGFIADP